MTENYARALMDEILQVGYAHIPNFLNEDQLQRVNSYFDAKLGKHVGRNNFEGHQTERIYTLVARDKVFQDIVEDERIMAMLDLIFMPNYLLTASQAIVIGPGESPQPWHTDDAFYAIPRPRAMISLSTIVAVEPFTQENGCTQMIPGSHKWGDEEVAGFYIEGDHESDPSFSDRLENLAVPLEMNAGDCVVFAGTLLHRGGPNHSNNTRRALSNQYCQPWARTQENFFLAISPEEIARMSLRVQSLLGYSIHPPFMGQVTASHPLKALEKDFVPPIYRK
jgi:ectoine hydroxylase-related dioxygenase (phytanoyl-CoA dioxygenase family)